MSILIAISSLFSNAVAAQAQLSVPLITGSSFVATSQFLTAQPRTANCPSPDPVSIQTVTSAPETCILNAIDGNQIDLISQGSTTTSSNSITFVVSGNIVHSTDTPINRFECSLDNSALSLCSEFTPAQNNVKISLSATNLAIGSHIFRVRAINTAGQTASTPANFTWTITTASASTSASSLIVPSTSFPSNAANTTANLLGLASQSAQNAALQSQSKTNAQNTNLAALGAETVTAAAITGALNPPLLSCTAAHDDVAIYKILGHANLRELFSDIGRSQGLIPVSFVMLEDTNPSDAANQIVNHNNPFIIGKLIAFPGNTNLQKSVDVELTKIDTECKTTAIISQREVLASKSLHPSQPAIIPPHLDTNKMNPPFAQCIASTRQTKAAGAIGSPVIANTLQQKQLNDATQTQPNVGFQAVPIPSSTSTTTSGSVPLTIGGQAAQNIPLPTGGSVLLGGQAAQNIPLPSGSTNNPALTGAAAAASASALGETLADPSKNNVDIAKYVIRGEINRSDLTKLNGHQDVLVTLFVDLNPQVAPENKVVQVKDSNNMIAATMQINPGDVGKWQITSFLLDEIFTSCETIPFVSKPLAIGDDNNADFATQVVSNRFDTK